MKVWLCIVLAGIASGALPVPPQQRAPWTAPVSSEIPDYVAKVAATLFDAGLADPRGGEYREIVLTDGERKTHGWVFAGGFAVCWDGMVYRVSKAGAVADLDADVRAIVASKPWSGRISLRRADDTSQDAAPFWWAMESVQKIAPASIALLLRVGRADLAAELWTSPETTSSFGFRAQRESDEASWLVTSATSWFANGYLRALGAFEAADDANAIEVAESVLQWRDGVPAEWRKKNNWFPKHVPDISFLEPLPMVLADAQRRVEEARQDRPGVDGLIERLEDVRGAKLMFPGPLFYSSDPFYKALKDMGDAAVEPLIDAYENDRRLTRTFDYSRPWSTEHTPIAVHEVVRLLLGEITGDPARIASSTPSELRAWWRETKSLSPVERFFRLLADDRASPKQWLEAAEFLTARQDGNVSACDPLKQAAAMNGEALRSRVNPSVRELLARRVRSMASTGSEVACPIAVKAALWDAATAPPVLEKAAGLAACRADARVTIARIAAGVPWAATDWATELEHHAKFPPIMVSDLAPLWFFPGDAGLEQAAERLFAADGAWSPVKQFSQINSALLAVPAFRRAVERELEDATRIGTVTRDAAGSVSFRIANGGGSAFAGSDARSAKPGETRTIRVKDLVAFALGGVSGAPAFGLDWGDADKDDAVRVMTEFLRRNEDRLRAFPGTLQETNCAGQRVYLTP